MSLTRRIAAAGLPAAGITVFASLALSGSPAVAAAGDVAGLGARPAVMTTPCAEGDRTKCGDYSGYGTSTTGPTATATTGTPGAGTPGGGTGPTHTRGHSGGYGGVSPSTAPTTRPTTRPTTPAPSSPAPSTTPTGNTDTVPPGGVSPTTATPAPSSSTPGGGVSPATALPVTGPPMGAMISLGAVLVAAGAGSVWYTRRRRTV
jgi:hypothetical protein